MIKLEGYKIIKKIGSGGMGDVYLAEHEVLETTVAIKSLHANLVTDESFKKRFRTEAKVHAKLDHPNVVKLIDFQERKDGLFIVMEYVEGKQLDDYIYNDSGPIPEKELLPLFAQIVDAISHAHAKGLVHRDIKPANVIISNGKIKVLDFGIAKEASTESGLTKTGVQVGTPMYMSPEQVNGEKIDKLTDIYSLGVTLFYMAVGKPPYENSNAIKMGVQILTEDFPTPKEFYPGVSNKIETIIKKATQKDKTDRYQSCEEFIRDLDSKNIIVSEKIKASTKTQVAEKKKKFKLSNIIAVAVVLLLVAGYFLYFDNNANTLPETYLVDGQEITLEDIYSDQVVITDLIWKKKSTMEPVFGRYVDSEGRYCGLIINGLKEGLWREWHANEQLSYEGAYNDGNNEGLHKVWFENGQLAFEGAYKDGKKEGLHKVWFENGQLAFEGAYKDENTEGFTHKKWDENGQLVLDKYYKTKSEKLAEEVAKQQEDAEKKRKQVAKNAEFKRLAKEQRLVKEQRIAQELEQRIAKEKRLAEEEDRLKRDFPEEYLTKGTWTLYLNGNPKKMKIYFSNWKNIINNIKGNSVGEKYINRKIKRGKDDIDKATLEGTWKLVNNSFSLIGKRTEGGNFDEVEYTGSYSNGIITGTMKWRFSHSKGIMIKDYDFKLIKE
jgi:serine/threonine protein kinase